MYDVRGVPSLPNGLTIEASMIKKPTLPLKSTTLEEAPTVFSGNLSYRFGTCAAGRLKPHPDNSRTHKRAQYRKLTKLIEKVGLGAPPVIDENKVILAGHARVEVCKELGMREIPVIQIFGLSETKKRAYVIADNRVALDAGWDRGRLATIIPELTVSLAHEELTIDEATGLEIVEIDQLRADFATDADPRDDVDLPNLSDPVISRLNDLFVLGDHRLLVGDAREASNFVCLMEGQGADVAVLDAPYNRPSNQIGGRGRVKHDDFIMGSGEWSNEAFSTFLSQTHANAVRFSRNGAVHYSFMDWRGIRWLLQALDPLYGAMLNLGVWVKTNPGQGSFLRSQHELVAIYRVGDAAYCNNVQLGKFGRSRSNVWTCAGANTFRNGRLQDLADHPTVKPVRLIADILKDCSRPGDIALDCFAGSGTMLLAAEQTGRRARVMELDPKYADVCVRRWQMQTGRDAVHAASGVTFDELQKSRLAPIRRRVRACR